MPLTAQQVESLSDEVSRLYGQAERLLLEKVARQIAQGLDSPTWAERKLVEVQLLLARLRGDLNTLAGQTAQEAARALLAAYNRGQAAALADLTLAQLATAVAAGANPAALDQVRRLIAEAASDLIGSHQRILRSVDDVYRHVVREASAQQLLGVQTRREAAQDALNRWADRGVTGFVDRTGRRWEMRSYAEMSMRTAARRASVEGHTDRLQAQGHDLVFVSDHSQECPQCRPWEGKVLSLSGAPRLDDVPVAGTLDQARAAGLLHPGCRHTIGAFLPGFTKVPKSTADPQGYADRQKLRYLERGVRAWKRREAVALDDAARRKARAKVREWQARIREHVESTSAKRQPFRESVGAAR